MGGQTPKSALSRGASRSVLAMEEHDLCAIEPISTRNVLTRAQAGWGSAAFSRSHREGRTMPSPQEIQEKFWKALKSDMTMMVGLDGVEDGHARPMTAQLDGDRGPIWFFTAKDNTIVQKLGQGNRAIATFTSKGHDIFATVHGTLSLDNDRATIDRLWNRFVAAWFEGGKDDPKLALLRLDPERGEVWVDASSVVAGIKMLLGVDPKDDYRDKVATVNLR
jgi:general stress protein 26